MKKTAAEVLREARSVFPNCNLLRQIETSRWSDIASLLLSPQGREAALHKGWPTSKVLRKIPKSVARDNGLYFNAGAQEFVDPKNDLIFVGDTQAEVTLSAPTRLYRFLVMQGASLTLIVKNYAVATLACDKDSFYIINDKDGTPSVNVER